MQVPKQRWCVPALAVTLLFLIRSVQRLAVKSSSTLLLRSGNLAHASMPRLLRCCPFAFLHKHAACSQASPVPARRSVLSPPVCLVHEASCCAFVGRVEVE